MEDNNYNRHYSKKPVGELIEQLRSHRISGTTLSQEWFEALKIHLNERELTADQRKLVDDILSADPKSMAEEEKRQMAIRVNENLDQPISSTDHTYPALRTISGVFIVLAVFVALASIVGGIFYFTKGDGGVIIGISTILGGAMTTLLLVAASEMIKLFIQIENNTRITANRK